MLSLSQSVNYAIRALACLERGRCGSKFVKDLAECAGVPPAYLAKLFTRLVGAGILEAKRGWKGGNRLTRPADQISLYDIAEALEGDQWANTCLLGRGVCIPDQPCPNHSFWTVERTRIAEELRKTTLAQVIAFDDAHAAN